MGRGRWRLELLFVPLALAALALGAGPAAACSERASVWEWDRCWLSVPRWLVLGATGAVWWAACFHLLFPRLLAPQENDPPLPSAAFRRCLALFWILFVLTFVALFALLSDELSAGTARSGPAALPWLGPHWKWALALALGGVVALALWAPRRK